MMTVPGSWHLDLFKLLYYHFLWCSFLLSVVNVVCRQINNSLSFAEARNKRGGSQQTGRAAVVAETKKTALRVCP